MCGKMKKKGVGKGWATAQLCHNTMRNCIVTQQVLGVQNVWRVCHNTTIVSWHGGLEDSWAGNCITTLGCWVLVYCNMWQLGCRGFVSQYTKCIVTGEAWATGACHNTLRCIVAHRRLSRHTVGSAVLWHIEG